MMGEAGRRRTLVSFTPERHAERVEDIYRHALARLAPDATRVPG
jgi:hypothetical protein